MSDHLDALDEQLKELADTLTIAANAATAAPTIIRKAQARVRALRREGTYRVTWARADVNGAEELVCTGLTPELAMTRIMGAIANSGPILVVKVERE